MGVIFCSECLDVLITSLDQAPLQRSHIPALFFLAETTLYWLRTDVIHQPYLRTGEIKLLKASAKLFFFTRMLKVYVMIFSIRPSMCLSICLFIHIFVNFWSKLNFYGDNIMLWVTELRFISRNLYVERHCI